MTNGRDKLLSKIKTSLRAAVLPGLKTGHPGSFQGYTYPTEAPPEALAAQFQQELEALSGHAYVITDVEEIVPVLLKILQQHSAQRILAWDDQGLNLPWLRPALTGAGITIENGDLAPDEAGRKARWLELDDIQVGLTGAQGGLADTGAVALISGPGRGRAVSLLPPVHIALLPLSCLYPSLPAFLADNPNATAEGSNLVLITGPSRTGDIEMTLTMGVHGPGEVHVVIVPG